MTALIFGVGVGLFLLAGIWLAAFVACFISAHTQRNLGIYAVALAVVLTVVLIFIPRESEKPSDAVPKVYDTFFLWRIALILLMVLCTIGGGVVLLLNHLMEPRVARPVKRWIF